MTQESSVICLYPNVDAAEEAVQKLGAGGFPLQQVSIITKDLVSEKKVHGFVTSCDVAKASAGMGAWVGGIFGLLAGAALIWVPGVGPLVVAGSLTAALLGAAEGAITGAAVSGFLGWLTALGISQQHILKYEESIKAGRALVVAHGTPEQVGKASTILETTSPSEIERHAQAA